MGTNCALLVDFVIRDFAWFISDNNQANINEAFSSTSRFLDDLLNIDNPYFEQIVNIYIPLNFN